MKYKAGDKGMTRSGHGYEVIGELKEPTEGGETLVVRVDGTIYLYYPNGSYHNYPCAEVGRDLMPSERWVNLYSYGDGLVLSSVGFPTEKQAREAAAKQDSRIPLAVAVKLDRTS